MQGSEKSSFYSGYQSSYNPKEAKKILNDLNNKQGEFRDDNEIKAEAKGLQNLISSALKKQVAD